MKFPCEIRVCLAGNRTVLGGRAESRNWFIFPKICPEGDNMGYWGGVALGAQIVTSTSNDLC